MKKEMKMHERQSFGSLGALMLALLLGLFTLGFSLGRAEAAPRQDQGALPSTLEAKAPSAESPVSIKLTVVHAEKKEGGVAPELQKMSRWLLRSFKDYASFSRLQKREDRLQVGESVKDELPNGTTLTYKHLGWDKGRATIEISVGGLESTVQVKDGRGFLQAGRSYQGGMLVLGFKVSSEL